MWENTQRSLSKYRHKHRKCCISIMMVFFLAMQHYDGLDSSIIDRYQHNSNVLNCGLGTKLNTMIREIRDKSQKNHLNSKF